MLGLPTNRVLEAVGIRSAFTASAPALPSLIAVISLVAIPPTNLATHYRFQNVAKLSFK